MRSRLLVLLALLTLPAGCIESLPEPNDERVVGGRVDGDSATNTYYKLFLVGEDGYRHLANFDRRDWYVTGIEREVRNREVEEATVEGRDRGLLNEVIVDGVWYPASLNEFRYDAMKSRAEARGEPFDKAALDAEWDARLAEIAQAKEATRALEMTSALAP